MDEQTIQAKIAQAKAMGIPDDMIQAKVAEIRAQSQPQQDQNSEAQARQGLAGALGQKVLNFGANMIRPELNLISNTGKQIQSGTVPQQDATDFLSKAIGPMSTLLGIGKLNQAVRPAAENAASFAVPFGKGASVVGKAIVPGMAVGALQGASEEGATPESVTGNAILGGAGAGLLHGATKAVGAIRGIGRGTEKVGTGLLETQFNLPRSIARQVKLPETVAKLSDYGISHIDKISEVAPLVTGSDGVITRMTRQAVGQAGNVSLDGLDGLAKEIVASPGIPVGQDKKLLTDFTKSIRNVVNTKKINNVGDPLEVYNLITALEKKAFSFGDKSIQATSADKAMRTAYLTMANELKDRLFVGAGADSKVVSAIADSGKLKALAAKYPKIAQDIMNARTVGELRNVAEPFVNGSIAAKVTESGQNLAIKNAGETVKGVGKLAQNPFNLIAVPLGSDTANAFIGKGVRSVGRATQSLPDIGVNSITGQLGARSLLQPPNQAQDQGTGNNANPNQNNPGNNGQGGLDHTISNDITNGGQSPLPPIQSPYSLDQLAQGYQKAVMAGDNEAATQIKKMYDMQALNDKGGTLSTAAQARHDALQTALASLDSAEANLVAGGGAQGPIKGAIATMPVIGGVLAPQGASYHNTRIELATQLAKAITGGSRPGQEVIKQYLDSLPDVNETPAYVQNKLNKLRKELLVQAKAFGFKDLLTQ